MKIKPIDQIVSRWVEGVRGASAAYQFGVQNPDRDWADATAAAAPNWFQGVQEAHTSGKFVNKVRSSGTAHWQNKTLTKGVQMWPLAVAAAEGDFRVGFQPFANALAAGTLPPRYPARDSRNMARVDAVVQIMISTANLQDRSGGGSYGSPPAQVQKYGQF